MRYAGIAWHADGFDVSVLRQPAGLTRPTREVHAESLQALVVLLLSIERAGDPIVCVVDSTNGLVDGALMAAGLQVYRADPWMLTERRTFGSVSAETLARAAATRLPVLTRLKPHEGSLTGRSEDHLREIETSNAGMRALELTGRCVTSGSRDGEPVIALTFDDGPNPPYTGAILDVLARYDVPATFFCVGLNASVHKEELARIAEAGHGLGNHTWSHPFLPDLSLHEFEEQLERTDEAMAAGGRGAVPTMFRPPYGSRSPEVVSWLAADAARPTVVLWDIDTEDWATPGAEAISASVLAQARPGSIALMHDGGGNRSQTVEALPSLIEGLLDRGYRFARVDDMLA